jgi:putative PIN family toxin of toxin-antitoxin system
VLRVVLDTTVYVSALIRPEGPPGQIIKRSLGEGPFEIVLSPAIVEETVRAFGYPKVRKYIHASVDPELWLDVILLAQFVAGDYELEGVSQDAEDDKYFGAAVEGSATLIVTGDPDLLTVKEYRDIRVVTPRVFLDLLSG